MKLIDLEDKFLNRDSAANDATASVDTLMAREEVVKKFNRQEGFFSVTFSTRLAIEEALRRNDEEA